MRRFSQQQRFEETVAALATLSGSRIEITRPLMQSLRHDGILVACKAAGLGWDTVSAILQSRYMSGAACSLEQTQAEAQFAAMNCGTARRLLRFW